MEENSTIQLQDGNNANSKLKQVQSHGESQNTGYRNMQIEKAADGSNDSSSAGLETTTGAIFTVFPKLPLEVRRKVWRFAGLQPRIIPVQRRTITRQLGEISTWASLYCTIAKQSALTMTCRESRREVLLFQKSLYQDEDLPYAQRRPTIYTNLDIDIILPPVNEEYGVKLFLREATEKGRFNSDSWNVKNVMMKANRLSQYIDRNVKHITHMHMTPVYLPNVAHIYWIVGKDECYVDDDGTLLPLIMDVSSRKMIRITKTELNEWYQKHFERVVNEGKQSLQRLLQGEPVIREELEKQLQALNCRKAPIMTYVRETDIPEVLQSKKVVLS